MVGGRDYSRSPVQPGDQRPAPARLGVQGLRARGGAEEGHLPDSVWASQQKEFVVPNSAGKEVFPVHNYEGDYVGSRCGMRSPSPTTRSSPRSASRPASTGWRRRRGAMGIRTPVSHNYAITLGGLKQGVTPLDMAHAYETLAQRRATGSPGRSVRANGRPRRHDHEVGAARRHDDPERDAQAHGAAARRGDDRDADAPGRHRERHRDGRGDRRLRGRQDRHDRELRRRLVRRLQREVHGGGLGRLPRPPEADADRVRRQLGDRRDLPGRDLARLHGRGARHPRPARRAEGARREGGSRRVRCIPTRPRPDIVGTSSTPDRSTTSTGAGPATSTPARPPAAEPAVERRRLRWCGGGSGGGGRPPTPAAPAAPGNSGGAAAPGSGGRSP